MLVEHLPATSDVYLTRKSGKAHLRPDCRHLSRDPEAVPARLVVDDAEVCSACEEKYKSQRGLAHVLERLDPSDVGDEPRGWL